MKVLFDTHAFLWWDSDPRQLSPQALAACQDPANTFLPAHHKDPFDRLLIAQANSEDAALLSSDPRFKGYPVKLLW